MSSTPRAFSQGGARMKWCRFAVRVAFVQVKKKTFPSRLRECDVGFQVAVGFQHSLELKVCGLSRWFAVCGELCRSLHLHMNEVIIKLRNA